MAKKKQKTPKLLSTFLKDKNVASILSTSKKTVKEICKRIDFSKDIVIVEYGPGNGPFTKYLLKHMSQNSKLIAIETNKEFVTYLSTITDERLYVTHDSAENILEIVKAANLTAIDYIISGIPFSFLKANQREHLLQDTSTLLKPHGHFFVYQVRPGIKITLSHYFPNVFSRAFRLNIPPLYFFDCSF